MMLRPSSRWVSGFGNGRPSRVPMPAARMTTENSFIGRPSGSSAGACLELDAVRGGVVGEDELVAECDQRVDLLDEALRALAGREVAEVVAAQLLSWLALVVLADRRLDALSKPRDVLAPDDVAAAGRGRRVQQALDIAAGVGHPERPVGVQVQPVQR